MLGSKLDFCGSTGLSCCSAADDSELREQFEAMNDDGSCAAIIKETLRVKVVTATDSEDKL